MFTVTPSIDGDGITSYEVTLLKRIDPKIDDSFALSDAVRIGGGNKAQLQVVNTDGNTLTLTGYDNDGAADIDAVDPADGWSQRGVNYSTQGIGIGSNFVTNSLKANNNDNIGQKLVLELSNDGSPLSARALGLKIDHLFDGEKVIWRTYSGDQKVGSGGELLGSGSGSSDSVDQVFVIDPGASFDRVEFFAAEDTTFRLLTSDVIVTLSDEPLVLDLSADITDSDEDSVSADFSIILDNMLETDLIISGTINEDLLQGAEGNETLVGGASADRLIGGGGADVFSYAALTDLNSATTSKETIEDFSSQDGDTLDFGALLSGATSLTNTVAITTYDGVHTSKSTLSIFDGTNTFELVVTNANDENLDGNLEALDAETLFGNVPSAANAADWTEIVSLTGQYDGSGDSTDGSAWTLVVPDGTRINSDIANKLTFEGDDGVAADVDVVISQGGITHEIDNVDEIVWTE